MSVPPPHQGVDRFLFPMSAPSPHQGVDRFPVPRVSPLPPPGRRPFPCFLCQPPSPPLKKSFSSKHEILSEYSNLILSFIFSKSQLFSLFLTCTLIGVSCGHDIFSDSTVSMQVRSTEKFLEAFEKSFSSKHEALSEYSNLILRFIFSKPQLFSLFLTYNLISVSCSRDFFTDAKI